MQIDRFQWVGAVIYTYYVSYVHIVLEFDQLVEKRKAEAIAAMEKAPEIRQTIAAAEQKTAAVEAALGGASEDAENALKIASEAKSVAEEAAKVCIFVTFFRIF